MLEMLRDLVCHNGHANAAILSAIRQNDAAVADIELGELLHHMLLANRFWLATVLGLPFDAEQESRPSRSFDVLIQRYGTTHEQQSAWLSTATEGDLVRVLESAVIPGGPATDFILWVASRPAPEWAVAVPASAVMPSKRDPTRYWRPRTDSLAR